jgi:hypothetical protein
VQQVTSPWVFVTLVGGPGSQQFTGEPVQVGQVRHRPAPQHRTDRRRRQRQLRSQLDRAGVLVDPGGQHRQLDT